MTGLLKVEGLTKQFGGLIAVKDVSFELAAGEIVGLLGPNGAGKTTLFNLLTGFIPADRGVIAIDGRNAMNLAPHVIVNLGVSRTFQLCRPFIGMTVLENVMVGCFAARAAGAERPVDRARRIVQQVGLGGREKTLVDVLPYGDLRRLEVARALTTRPRLLLLDEPYAGLGLSEIEPLSALIRQLHHDEGLTILIVEHHLRELMRLVRRVIVMDFGEIIANGLPDAIVRDPRVIDAYIGREESETTEAGRGAA